MSCIKHSRYGGVEVDGRFFDGELPETFSLADPGVRFVPQRRLDNKILLYYDKLEKTLPLDLVDNTRFIVHSFDFSFVGAGREFADFLLSFYTTGTPFTFRYNDLMSRYRERLYPLDSSGKIFLTPTFPVYPPNWKTGEAVDASSWECTLEVNGAPYMGNFTIYPKAGIIVLDSPVDPQDEVLFSYEWAIRAVLRDLSISYAESSKDFYNITGSMQQLQEDITSSFYVVNESCPVCGDGSGRLYKLVNTFYLANTLGAGNNPPVSSGWDLTSTNFHRRKLVDNEESSQDSSGIAVSSFGNCEVPGGDQNSVLVQFVSAPLYDGTLSGNVDLVVQFNNEIAGFNGGAAGRLYVAAKLSVYRPSTSSYVGNLTPVIHGGELPQGIFSSVIAFDNVSLTNTNVQRGDVIVLEIGMYRTPPGNANPFCEGSTAIRLRRGSHISGSTVRLPRTNGDTSSDKVPWLFFTNPVKVVQ
jgi:hypothetical protein